MSSEVTRFWDLNEYIELRKELDMENKVKGEPKVYDVTLPKIKKTNHWRT